MAFPLLPMHLFLFAASVWAAAATDACTDASSPKKFSGVRLNLLSIHWGKDAVETGIRAWENRTGAQITTSWVTSPEALEHEISSDLFTGAAFFDGYVCTNKQVPMWASQDLLADLTDVVRNDPELGWSDILPVFRNTVAVYGGRVVTVPWDGDVMVMYYRRDLAERDGWAVPRTWEEFVEVAQRYDGQDLNDDGTPDYGACLCSDPDSLTFYHWITPMLTMVQSQGPQQGAFLNLTEDGVAPLVNNAAFRRTIEIMRAAHGSYPMGNMTYSHARDDFAAGRCAVYFTWPSGGTWSIKTQENGSYVYMHGRMGVANVPGSRQVMNWTTGDLVDCNPELCPHAIDPNTGEYDGINRVAWYANGGMGSIVNKAASPARQEAMVDFLMWYAANVDTRRPSPYNPFRRNHFNVEEYIEAGWDPEDAKQYLDAETEVLELNNAVLDFRVPFIGDFFQAYNSLYVQLLGNEVPMDVTVSEIETNVWRFIEKFGTMVQNPQLPGKLELERIYRQSIGLAMRPIIETCESGLGYVETNAELGTGECLACSPGKYGPGGANQVCLDCAAGRATEEPGLALCASCGAGTYAPKGSATCLPCPHGTAPGVAGQEVCPCDKGWFGGDNNCTKCPEPMTTKLLGAREPSECVCPEGTVRPLNGTAGNCVACQRGLYCETGSDEANFPGSAFAVSRGTYPLLEPSFFTNKDDPLNVFQCKGIAECPGGPPGTCAPYATGLVCASCEDGFVKLADGCTECVETLRSPLMQFGLPFLAGPPMVWLLYQLSQDDIENWASASLGANNAVVLALMYSQSLAVVKATIDSKDSTSSWMLSPFEGIKATIQFTDVSRPACAVGSDFVVLFTWRTFMPVTAAVVVFAAFWLSRVSPRITMGDRDLTLAVYGGIFDSFYISTAAQCFSLFQCYHHPNGKASLRSAAEVLCYESVWNSLVAVAVLAILVFCVASMVLYAYIIHKAPACIHDRAFRMRWKFILRRFRPSQYQWGLVLLTKGVWMNLAPVLTTDISTMFVLRFAGFLVYFAGTSSVNPWRKPEINLLDTLVHALLLLNLCCLELLVETDRRHEVLDASAFLWYMGVAVCAGYAINFIYQRFSPHVVVADDREQLLMEILQSGFVGENPELIADVLRRTDLDVAQGLHKFTRACTLVKTLGRETSRQVLCASLEQDESAAKEARITHNIKNTVRRTSSAVGSVMRVRDSIRNSAASRNSAVSGSFRRSGGDRTSGLEDSLRDSVGPRTSDASSAVSQPSNAATVGEAQDLDFTDLHDLDSVDVEQTFPNLKGTEPVLVVGPPRSSVEEEDDTLQLEQLERTRSEEVRTDEAPPEVKFVVPRQVSADGGVYVGTAKEMEEAWADFEEGLQSVQI